MLGDRYVVVRGDNLWRIATKMLGSGGQWPRIWRYNNRRAVVRVTGRGIPNPDLIYVGQTLLIPRLPGQRTVHAGDPDPGRGHLDEAQLTRPSAGGQAEKPKPSTQGTPSHKRQLSDEVKQLRSPLSFKYRLDLRWPAQDVGTAILEVRLTGDFVLMSQKTYPATYVTRSDVEHQITAEANNAFAKLMSDQRFIFDPKEKKVTYRSMLVTQSTTPNLPATAVGVEMSSTSPLPKLRAELRIAKLEGSYGGFVYAALDQKFVIEITPKPQPPTAPPSHKLQPVAAESPWAAVLGAGLVVSAGVLVVCALADEWIPVLGQLDDAPAFAGAAALLGSGLALMGGTSANLPAGAVPAHIEAKVTVTGKGL
jgi:hypothetical protein